MYRPVLDERDPKLRCKMNRTIAALLGGVVGFLMGLFAVFGNSNFIPLPIGALAGWLAEVVIERLVVYIIGLHAEAAAFLSGILSIILVFSAIGALGGLAVYRFTAGARQRRSN